MPENEGLFAKFNVSRRDGRDAPGGDRENAAYFVLDVVNDPHAREALRAYYVSCRTALPGLARDLARLLNELYGAGEPGPMVQALRQPKEG